MAYASAISRLLNQAGCLWFQVVQSNDGFVSVCGPRDCTPELLRQYAQAIPDRYHVRVCPREPDRVLLVSDRDSPKWEPREE